jgi:hypothetical protein
MSASSAAKKQTQTKADQAQIVTVWMPSFPLPVGVKVPASLIHEMLARKEGEQPKTGFRQSELFGLGQRFYRRPERFIEGVLEWGGVKGYFVEKRDAERRVVDVIMTSPAAQYTIRNVGGDTIDIAHDALGKAIIAVIDGGPNNPTNTLDVLRKHAVEAR